MDISHLVKLINEQIDYLDIDESKFLIERVKIDIMVGQPSLHVEMINADTGDRFIVEGSFDFFMGGLRLDGLNSIEFCKE